MPPEAFDYLTTQRVGVLAVEMLDGSPHAATVHFAHREDPFTFFFKTDPNYRKAEAVLGRELSRASFVVGSNEAEMKTLQMDGTVQVLHEEEMQAFEDVYLGKFPEKKAKHPDGLLFTFTPTWWRFTDWHTPEGKKIWVADPTAIGKPYGRKC